MLIIIVLTVSLAAIFYQDLRYRQIHIIWPLLLFVAGSYLLTTNEISLILIVYNTAFFCIMFLILVLYMSVKGRKLLNPFKNYFGLGDLLYYLAITPLFILSSYMLYFIFSMIFSIVCFWTLRKVINKDCIPLAGFAALLLLLTLCLDLFFKYSPLTLVQ